MNDVAYPDLKARRDQMRELRWCICGPFAPPGTPSRRCRVQHGPVVRGGKCARCLAVHRGSNRSPKSQSRDDGEMGRAEMRDSLAPAESPKPVFVSSEAS
jgi:hypothetical protein